MRYLAYRCQLTIIFTHLSGRNLVDVTHTEDEAKALAEEDQVGSSKFTFSLVLMRKLYMLVTSLSSWMAQQRTGRCSCGQANFRTTFLGIAKASMLWLVAL